MTWGLFLQEENSPKMRVIRVGTRKSQVSAGTERKRFVGRILCSQYYKLGFVPSSSGMEEMWWLGVKFHA